jgi:tRNA A-37 threonylcarbamoyl transferase component Bud32
MDARGLAGFIAERDGDAITLAREDLADDLRELGLFASDGLARLRAACEPIAGGRDGAGVLALPRAGERVVVRSLRHGGLLASILGQRYWGAARVERELRVAYALTAAGAPVAAPAFALARRRVGPLWQCAIATQHVAGAHTLLDALRATRDAEARAASLAACATALRALHDRGGRHADLNATNVLVGNSGTTPRATLIDLDRARIAEPVPARRRAREIARLFRSLAKHAAAAQPSAAERDAFVAAYCAGDETLEPSLRRWLKRERLRTALHALHYARR